MQARFLLGQCMSFGNGKNVEDYVWGERCRNVYKINLQKSLQKNIRLKFVQSKLPLKV